MTSHRSAWDIDRAWGEEAEGVVSRLLGNPRVEVKRKRFIDDFVYVELEQDPYSQDVWKPSGLQVTEAEYWAYVIGETGLVFCVPTDVLRWSVDRGEGMNTRTNESDNPTRGRLLRISRLIQVLRAD